jgi:hypothetical protein
MEAIGASDLIQVGGQHMILMPVDKDILDYLGMWGAEDEDAEDDDPTECNGDLEEECEDEGAEVDDEAFIDGAGEVWIAR